MIKKKTPRLTRIMAVSKLTFGSKWPSTSRASGHECIGAYLFLIAFAFQHFPTPICAFDSRNTKGRLERNSGHHGRVRKRSINGQKRFLSLFFLNRRYTFATNEEIIILVCVDFVIIFCKHKLGRYYLTVKNNDLGNRLWGRQPQCSNNLSLS